MYPIFQTFFGIPLSQRKKENSVLQALVVVCEDGYGLEELTPKLLAKYKSLQVKCELSDESLSVLAWVVDNRASLTDLGFQLNSAYSGVGDEMPMWFGFSVDMPHRSALNAAKLLEKHAEEVDMEKSKKACALFKQAPPSIAKLLSEECGFYSMYGTS